ncbi:hypothetical protein [Pseudomonas sp. MWU13-2105]|uniref:hypothetical protein n=1 Tax=Pseudomonas sp. MWU13-2105 TaxID=2935074 RepID=UPI00200FE095|nr:hypothetical protein [Pseudomonas sp. MWU13-2105]
MFDTLKERTVDHWNNKAKGSRLIGKKLNFLPGAQVGLIEQPVIQQLNVRDSTSKSTTRKAP